MLKSGKKSDKLDVSRKYCLETNTYSTNVEMTTPTCSAEVLITMHASQRLKIILRISIKINI